MNLFEKLKKTAKREEKTLSQIETLPQREQQSEARFAGRDDTGAPVYGEEIVRALQREADKRRAARLPYELQWRLNRNFLAGNQHCDIDTRKMAVENYHPPYDYMSEEVFNKIAPIMESRMAQLNGVGYDIEAVPGTTEYEDVRRAAVATALIRGKLHSNSFKAALDRARRLCENDGSAFFLSWWSAEEGAGAPTDTVLSADELLPADLSVESVEEQPSIIIEQIKTPEEVLSTRRWSPQRKRGAWTPARLPLCIWTLTSAITALPASSSWCPALLTTALCLLPTET